MKSVHSQRLENWLGSSGVEEISRSMRGWYGPPIRVLNIPGHVYATGDGDFVGAIRGGTMSYLMDFVARKCRAARVGMRGMNRRPMLSAGFSSLSDLIAEATVNGKGQDLFFSKVPTTGTTAGNAVSTWNVGSYPAAGGSGGTSGTGVECTSATAGAMTYTNPTGGDTMHFVRAEVSASAISSLMLYDRLWDMRYDKASSTSTAIDSANRPTRYQTAALAPGNFISGEVTTNFNSTAHTFTHTYVDQDGNTAEAATAYTAPASAVVCRSPTAVGEWFVPLNAGDTGLRYLTNIAQSTTASVTGVCNWWIGHPIFWCPCPIANVPTIIDGINSAFNLTRIYDNACLAWYTPRIATTGTITYTGMLKIVAG